MALKHDPILGTEREVGIIAQKTTDPTKAERATIVSTGGITTGTTGSPIGLLLTLTHAPPVASAYEYRFMTKEGTVVGTTLT